MVTTCWPNHHDCPHREYIGRDVTLNGKEAIILTHGRGNALVVLRNGEAARFSWMGVFNTCDNHGGRFIGTITNEEIDEIFK